MTVLPFATQINNAGAAIEANSPIEGEVIFCVQGVASPLLANIALHGMERDTKEALDADLRDAMRRDRKDGKASKHFAALQISIIRYADDCVPRTY